MAESPCYYSRTIFDAFSLFFECMIFNLIDTRVYIKCDGEKEKFIKIIPVFESEKKEKI